MILFGVADVMASIMAEQSKNTQLFGYDKLCHEQLQQINKKDIELVALRKGFSDALCDNYRLREANKRLARTLKQWELAAK